MFSKHIAGEPDDDNFASAPSSKDKAGLSGEKGSLFEGGNKANQDQDTFWKCEVLAKDHRMLAFQKEKLESMVSEYMSTNDDISPSIDGCMGKINLGFVGGASILCTCVHGHNNEITLSL